MAFVSTTAYGQYGQRPQQPQPLQQAQQNWAVPIVQASARQEPALAVQSNAAPVAQGAYDCAVENCLDRYITIFGGSATFNDLGFNVDDIDAQGVVSTSSTIVEPNNGWTVGGGIGKRFRRRVRGELEWSYRNASLNEASTVLNGVVQTNDALDGQLNVYRQTSNLLFDLNPEGRFNAYFGGGVGVGFLDLDAADPATPVSARLTTSSFVYQGIAGFSTKINCRTEVFVDYRYSGTDKLELDTTTPAGSSTFTVDLTSNDIFFGVRLWR